MNNVALITGASGGIGLALARRFAEAQYDLVLVARSAGKLEQIAQELRAARGVQVTVLPADLADPAAPEAIFQAMAARGIDVLVNNAGFGWRGPFVESDPRTQWEMIQVNVTSLVQLTRLFLPGMVARGAGRVLNVGSTGSFSPAPLMAVYAATKAFVLSFSEALSEELKGTGVTVTALCPGLTTTGFQERARTGRMGMTRMQVQTAEAVAEAGYRALMRGQPVIVTGLLNNLMIQSIRIVPRSVTRRISHALMKGE